MPVTYRSGLGLADWNIVSMTVAKYGKGMFRCATTWDCASIRTVDGEVFARLKKDKHGITWECWEEAKPRRIKSSDQPTRAVEHAVIDLMATMFHMHTHASLARDLRRQAVTA